MKSFVLSPPMTVRALSPAVAARSRKSAIGGTGAAQCATSEALPSSDPTSRAKTISSEQIIHRDAAKFLIPVSEDSPTRASLQNPDRRTRLMRRKRIPADPTRQKTFD